MPELSNFMSRNNRGDDIYWEMFRAGNQISDKLIPFLKKMYAEGNSEFLLTFDGPYNFNVVPKNDPQPKEDLSNVCFIDFNV